MNKRNRYNMGLLKKLNNEYKHKKVMETYPHYDDQYQLSSADRRIDALEAKMEFNGKNILEIGCGGGYTIYRIAQRYDCKAVGIDIYNSDVWKRNVCSNLIYRCVDLGEENPFKEESFDYVISYVAWEHMKHPFEVLQQATKLLKKEGMFYLSANLYRSAIASHLYRNIYFPFPHLLFDENIIIRFALKQGVEKWFIDAFFHLNKLTYAQYKEYFQLLNLNIESENTTIRNLDYDFYNRFEDKLGFYPISDLELDFFNVFLRKTEHTVIRKHIKVLEIIVEDKEKNYINETIRFICLAEGADLLYAWYIYKNGIRINTIWYNKDNMLSYEPTEEGQYYVSVFVKDNVANIKKMESKHILVDSK